MNNLFDEAIDELRLIKWEIIVETCHGYVGEKGKVRYEKLLRRKGILKKVISVLESQKNLLSLLK